MIDTDKYEGHTEGPWYHHMDDYVEALDLDVPLSVCTLAEGEHKEANAILIQDAPLLLEEVKRLCKNIKGYIAIWDYLDPKGYAWQEEKVVTLLKEHGFDTGDDEE